MLYENKRDSFIITNKTTSIEYPLHLHQYIEIAHILSGCIEMHIGSKKFLLYPGDLAVAFPNVVHSYHTLSTPDNTRLYILNCYPDLLPIHSKTLLNMQPVSPVLRSAQVHDDVYYAENRLLELDPIEPDFSLVSSLLSLICSRLFPFLQLTKTQNPGMQDLSQKMIAYIADHYREDLSLDILASCFGVSKYQISRTFSNILGINFITYINSLRISYAEYLLLRTSLSIIQIAFECGYHNQQTFNRVFRELEGCTPKSYREEHIPYIDVSTRKFCTGETSE